MGRRLVTDGLADLDRPGHGVGKFWGHRRSHRTQPVPPATYRFTTVPYKGIRVPGGLGVFMVDQNYIAIPKPGAQSETTIAIDPTNPLHMFASSNDLAS